MITYFELGKDKQLNDIVFAGSHDAGITGGGKNVQTQDLDIGGQASAGVRIFDLRIAAATVPGKYGNVKGAELRAFHADGMFMKNESKTRHLEDVGRPVDLTRTKLSAGAFGMGLTKMLEDARDFVQSKSGSSEFLLLKFDKCTNWGLIAEACTTVLDKVLLKADTNLNITPLKALSGKVLPLFSPGGVKELAGKVGPKDGIHGIRNLYDKESGGLAYSPSFKGLQYYGKGGTSVMKPNDKIGQNEKKQAKLLEGAKFLGDPDVMGMMYWTTTGLLESIKKRNDKMWDAPNVARMRKLWAQGLEEFIMQRNPLSLPPGSPAVGPTRKRFMPNIVMIDFADEQKCRVIRGLNDLSPSDLAAL